MAHLLIIGGSGFFGKSILDSYRRGLLNRFDITTITVMARSADKLLSEDPDLLSGSIKLLNADIAKCASLPFADFIIHAAASTDERNYINHAKEERLNIQAGTFNFCKLASKYCKGAKIVYVSSGAIYGQQPLDLSAIPEVYNPGPIDDMPIAKRDYAAAKRDSESAIYELAREGLNVSIARCFSFVGPYLPRDQHFAIGNFIDDGLNNRAIKVRAAHSVYRSYMHADDLVQWLMTIAKNSSTECPIFNVGSDHAVSIRGLAEKIANYFGVSAEISRLESNMVDRYVPSIQKARNTLGLSIKICLEDAISRTINAIKF